LRALQGVRLLRDHPILTVAPAVLFVVIVALCVFGVSGLRQRAHVVVNKLHCSCF